MYATVVRRRMNQPRVPETRERAEREFWPKLRQAPGFVSFSIIQGEDGLATAVTLFETKTDADAFQGEAASWMRTLEELGHQTESMGAGEVMQHFTADA